MANIRPNQLPPATTITNNDRLILDQGAAGVNAATPKSLLDTFAPVATQAEAEAGTDNVKRMTPLRAQQHLLAQGVPNTRAIIAGDGLAGGGTLDANLELALSSTSLASLALADSAVQSVNGKAGPSITLTKSDVGLGNVDNTSDANKPISTATQTALNAKANSSVTITAGAGLDGGGDLSASRTIALDAASTASLSKADTALQAPGGVSGQVLVKQSAADNDVSWEDVAAATAVSYGPQTLTPEQQVQARQNIQADHSYDTIADITSATVPAYANTIRTNGYYAAGDGGAALYKRVASEPSHAGKVQSADGAWYELADQPLNVKVFGAKGDGVTDDTEALAKLIAYANAKGGHFLFGGCKVVNNGTHIITGKGIWLDSEGSGEILHSNPEDPAFIVGSDDVRAERVKIIGFRFEMIGENVDLFAPAEFSAYIAAQKVEVAAAVCIRQATSVEVSGCTSHNFLRLVSLKGKVSISGQPNGYLWNYDITVANNTAYQATYLMTADIVDGFRFHGNGMIGYQMVWTDSVSPFKYPHLLYIIDRSVPPARNVSISNCWTNGLEYGGALVIRGGHRITVDSCTFDGVKAIMADSVDVLAISNINFKATIADMDFPNALDIRACKNFVINGVELDLRDAYRPRAIVLQSLAGSTGYDGILDGDLVRGFNGLVSNVNIRSNADSVSRRYSIDVTGQSNVHFRNITINHQGVINPALINIAPDETDTSFQSENITFDNIVVTTDGVSQNFDRVFIVRAGTSNIRINVNQKDLSFPYNRSWTVNDQSGTAVVTVDRIRNKDLSVDLRADGQTGSAASPIFNLGLPDDNIGFFRPSQNNLAVAAASNEVFRFAGNAVITYQNLRPATDGTIDLGAPSNRWDNVRAAVGTINTSDARSKTPVAPLNTAEIEAAKALASEVGTFQFLASIQEKGEDARLHVGMTVQRAIEIMESHGLDPMRYGFICYDEWEDEYEPVLDELGEPTGEMVLVTPAGSSYGFRSDQLALFIARGLEARLSALEV